MKKFNQKIYISLEERAFLARDLGLTEYQVQIWFANRRTKMKKTQDLQDPKAMSKSKAPQASDSLPKVKPFQVDALSKMTEIERKMKNPEVIDILDDEDDLCETANSFQKGRLDDVSAATNQASAKMNRKMQESVHNEIGRENLQSEMIHGIESHDPQEEKMEDLKDREIEILKQEIKIILNDMVKKSVMEKEVEAWKTKYEAAIKGFKEKEQVVKNLEIKIPNMIKEFTKCVENKEYLLDIKEKELKKTEIALVDKETQLKSSQLDIVRLNTELEQWKKEKNDFVLKVASLDVKASKLSNEVLKKDMELKKTKEKEKENALKMKQMSQDMELNKADSVAQNLNNSEISNLKAILENQVNSLANLTKTCDYQKSQISYFRREVETNVELISKKETELQQIKDNVSNTTAIQANVNQLMIKSENQNKIIENQKTIISKYKVQTDEQAKQILKLADLQEKVKENDDTRNALKQSLEKKTYQVKNMKKTIEVKNEEMKEFKSAQDQLFSQVNDLELKNFNKTQELKKVEAKCENLKTQDKKSLKPVSIHEAAKEYMKLMKENHINRQVTKPSVKKNAPVITLDEQTEVEEGSVEPVKNIRTGSTVSETNLVNNLNGSIRTEITAKSLPPNTADPMPLKFNLGEDAVPYVSVHDITQETTAPHVLNGSDSWPREAIKMDLQKQTNPSSNQQTKVLNPMNHQPIHMLTYLWPLVSTEIEQISSPSREGIKHAAASVIELPTPKPSVGKTIRKLVKRPNVDMSVVARNNRSGVKRKPLVTDSGIPNKKKRTSSRHLNFNYKNLFEMTKTFSLPATPNFNTWDKLMKMKLKLRSSMFSKSNTVLHHKPSPLHPSLIPLAVGYNWPIVPYTYLVVSQTFNRPRVQLPETAGPTLRLCQDQVFSWPIVPYTKRTELGWLNPEAVNDQKLPSTLESFDLLFSSNILTFLLLPEWPQSLRQRFQVGDKRKSDLDGGRSKRLKIDSPVWPLVLYRDCTVVEESVPVARSIRSFDLLYPRESLSSGQSLLLRKKRSRGENNLEETPKSKKFKLSTMLMDGSLTKTPTSWPVAIIQQTKKLSISCPKFPSVMLHFTLPPSDTSTHLSSQQVDWPLLPFKDCRIELLDKAMHSNYKIGENLPCSQLTEVQLLFPLSPLLSLRLAPERTYPLVPYNPVQPSRIKKRLRPIAPSEPEAKKIKLCKKAYNTRFLNNHDICKQLVLSLIKVLPTTSSETSRQDLPKIKKYRISHLNRPKVNQLFL